MNTKINYDLDKANKAVLIFKKYFSSNENVAIIEYPDIIKYKSNEYFIYLFYSCLLDYGMKSKMYHSNLINTYLKYPAIFDPEYVLNNTDDLDDILRNSIHVRYPRVAKTKWLKLSEFLRYEDNLKDKLYSFNTYEELSSYINEVHSYGQKTGGLLKRIIADIIGKYYVEEIPIDRHDIEISYLLGVVDSPDLTNNDIRILSDVWVMASKNININPSLVDGYLWTIGVNFCNIKLCCECPLKDICRHKE